MPKNVRQQELGEMLRQMLLDARDSAIKNSIDNGLNPYDFEIDTEDFLARFRIFRDAGYYASIRYFRDFLEVGIFQSASTKNLKDSELPEAFKLGRKWANKKPKRVQLPENKAYPKPKRKKSKKG